MWRDISQLLAIVTLHGFQVRPDESRPTVDEDPKSALMVMQFLGESANPSANHVLSVVNRTRRCQSALRERRHIIVSPTRRVVKIIRMMLLAEDYSKLFKIFNFIHLINEGMCLL